jgi:multidrug resistance efflux pump
LDSPFNRGASLPSLDGDPSYDFEAVETLKQRLDQEKRARESLEQRFQQLQSNLRTTDEEIDRRNQLNADVLASKQEVNFLRSTVTQWQAAQDEEKRKRISLEQSLERSSPVKLIYIALNGKKNVNWNN